MSNIITDIKKIDFSRSAITFFCPNGKIICINKIENKGLHIEYLKILSKSDKDIKNIMSKFDYNYYLENPAKVLTEIMPEFAKINYSAFMNLNPNVLKPTNYACFVLPEDVPKVTKTLLRKMEDKFSDILFVDICKYNSQIGSLWGCLNGQYDGSPNYFRVIEAINQIPSNNNKNTK